MTNLLKGSSSNGRAGSCAKKHGPKKNSAFGLRRNIPEHFLGRKPKPPYLLETCTSCRSWGAWWAWGGGVRASRCLCPRAWLSRLCVCLFVRVGPVPVSLRAFFLFVCLAGCFVCVCVLPRLPPPFRVSSPPPRPVCRRWSAFGRFVVVVCSVCLFVCLFVWHHGALALSRPCMPSASPYS